MEMSLLDVKCVKYKPIVMASAAIFLVRKIYKKGDWDADLKEISEQNEREVKFCARDIFLSLQKIENSKFDSVRRKFSTKEYLEVSKFKIQQGK